MKNVKRIFFPLNTVAAPLVKSAEKSHLVKLNDLVQRSAGTAAIAAKNVSLLPQWRNRKSLKDLLSAIDHSENTVRFVGGCVRDSLLSLAVKDIDLATQHTPDALIKMLHKAGFKTIPVGLTHGTVRVLVGRDTYEITTLRTDTETDGRHATIAFTTDWYEDASRRDFTCNALYLSPSGDLYDPFDGMEDLKKRHLRFIGSPDDRLKEDYLRTLRFFRFYGRFGRGDPDPVALQALTSNRNALLTLSKERLTSEMKRILSLVNPLETLRLMAETLLLPTLLGEEVQCDLLEKICFLEGDLQSFLPPSPDWILRLAALLIVEGKKTSTRTPLKGLAYLRLSLKEEKRLERLLRHAVPASDSDSLQDLASLLYYYGAEEAKGIVLLQEALYSLDQPLLDSKERLQQALFYSARWVPKKFPLTGEDALALGLKGKAIGVHLGKVEKWWLAERCGPSRNACLEKLSGFKV